MCLFATPSAHVRGLFVCLFVCLNACFTSEHQALYLFVMFVYIWCVVTRDHSIICLIVLRPTIIFLLYFFKVRRHNVFRCINPDMLWFLFRGCLFCVQPSGFNSLFKVRRHVVMCINRDIVVGLCSELLKRLSYYIHLAYCNHKDRKIVCEYGHNPYK